MPRCRALMALNVKIVAERILNAFVQQDSVVLLAKMLVGIRMIFLIYFYSYMHVI